MINGVEPTHADIIFNLFGVPVIGMTKISYSDPQDINLNYGTGQHPTSRGFGQIKPTASVTLTLKEVQRLIAAAPGGRLQNIPDFDIGVNFATEAGDFFRHRIKKARFKGNSLDSSTGNNQIEQTLELSIAGIDWNAG